MGRDLHLRPRRQSRRVGLKPPPPNRVCCPRPPGRGSSLAVLAWIALFLLGSTSTALATESVEDARETTADPVPVQVLSTVLHGGRGEPERDVYAPGERLYAVVELEQADRLERPLHLEIQLVRGRSPVDGLRARGRARAAGEGQISLGVGLPLPEQMDAEDLGTYTARITLHTDTVKLFEETRTIEIRSRLGLDELYSLRPRTAPGGLHTIRGKLSLLAGDAQARQQVVRWSMEGNGQTTGGTWRVEMLPGEQPLELDILVPAGFPTGSHQVRITVQDEASGQQVQASLPIIVEQGGGTTGASPVDLDELPGFCGPGEELASRRAAALADGVGLVQLHGIDEPTLEELLELQGNLIRQGGRAWQWVIHARSTQPPGVQFERVLDGSMITVMRKALPLPREERQDFLRAARRILSGYIPQRSARIPFSRPTESQQP